MEVFANSSKCPKNKKNFYNSTTKNKRAKDLARHFSEDNIQVANQHIKRRSSLATWEVHVQIAEVPP